MGRDLHAHSAAARDVFATLDAIVGEPLSASCFEGPVEALHPTHVQQLAVVATSLAALAAFNEALGLEPWPPVGPSHPIDVVGLAGHSVGLCTAMVASGVLRLDEGIALVRDRGRSMAAAAAARPGTMAAVVGLEFAVLDVVVAQVRETTPGSYLSVANINAPEQVVVAGDLGSIAVLHDAARAAGARRVIPLQVSGAFHSIAMLPARDAMRERVIAVGLEDPPVPVVSNVDGSLLRSAAALRAELADHIAAPVQWLRGVRELESMGTRHFVEFGHGNVLTGMLRRTVSGIALHNVHDAASAAQVAGELAGG